MTSIYCSFECVFVASSFFPETVVTPPLHDQRMERCLSSAASVASRGDDDDDGGGGGGGGGDDDDDSSLPEGRFIGIYATWG